MICRQPIGPMIIGSNCPECGHPAPAHADDGPCIMCWTDDKLRVLQSQVQAIIDRETVTGERHDRHNDNDIDPASGPSAL